jgi:hypothetical protein
LTIWKKAISAVTSAALLASLLASAAVAQVGTSGQSDQTNVLDCTAAAVHTLATCSQVADGISTVTLSGDVTPPRTETGKSLYITASGATIIGVAGQFVLAGGIVTGPAGQVVAVTDQIVVRAPSAAGSATVSVYEITTATGIATLEGTLTITFTASSGLEVSASNSVVKTLDSCSLSSGAFNGTKVTAAPALPSNTWVAYLCVLVKDGNGSAVPGAVVSGTITPVGGLQGDFFGQTTTATTGADGVAWIDVYTTGLAGAATISTSATINSKTTAFTPVTFTFAGSLATITATSQVLTVYYNGWSDHVVRFTGADAAGNKVFFAGSDTYSSDTSVFTIDHVDPYDGNGDIYDGAVEVTCAKVGSANVVVKQGSIASNAVKVYCSDWPDSFTVAFDKTVVAPGGAATLTVNVLDENGQPAAADGEDVDVVVSSGAISPSSTEVSDGAGVFTYLAPFNFGTATALVTVDGITGSKSASINIGAPAVVVPLGSTASTLGVAPPGGTWSTATKVAKVGSFITWRFAAGVANAGKTIGVFLQTKDANGVWSASTRFSARVADSSGNAYFSWKGTSAMWVSIRGGLGDARSTPPVQGRWTP